MLTNSLADEILEPGEGQVRALIVSGGNPIVAFPDQAKTEAAFAALELLVVIDPRMTPTAEMAHYVIAPRLELERADVPHIMDRRLPAPYTNYTPAVVGTDDDLLTEWEVFAGIAARNGTEIDAARRAGAPRRRQRSRRGWTTTPSSISSTATARMPMAEIREQPGRHPRRPSGAGGRGRSRCNGEVRRGAR